MGCNILKTMVFVNPAEQYILKQKEPFQSIMLYMRSVIFRTLSDVEEKYNYSIPFYHYKKKPFCYFNILKRTDFVDLAFIKGGQLQKQFPELKDYNNRKKVRSLQYKELESIDENRLIAIIREAAQLSDQSRKVL